MQMLPVLAPMLSMATRLTGCRRTRAANDAAPLHSTPLTYLIVFTRFQCVFPIQLHTFDISNLLQYLYPHLNIFFPFKYLYPIVMLIERTLLFMMALIHMMQTCMSSVLAPMLSLAAWRVRLLAAAGEAAPSHSASALRARRRHDALMVEPPSVGPLHSDVVVFAEDENIKAE